MIIGSSLLISTRMQTGSRGAAGQDPMLLADQREPRRGAMPSLSMESAAASSPLDKALWMSKADALTPKRAPEPPDAATSNLRRKAAPVESARDAFLDLSKMSLAERMRVEALKKMGLSEEALDQMDPEARAIVEAKLREIILRDMGIADGGSLPTGPDATGGTAHRALPAADGAA
jgi:hypothetical protein